jgi:hypothetical protein
MAITAGTDILASDFINTSAGAGDSGKAPKLNSSGKLDKSFPSRFGVKAIQTGTQGFSDGLVLQFAGESWDDDTMHDNVTNNTRITFKTAGTWLVGVSITGTGGSSNSANMVIRLNGTTVIAGGAVTDTITTSKVGGTATLMRAFIVNDYIEVLVYGTNSPTTSGDEGTHIWAQIIQTT